MYEKGRSPIIKGLIPGLPERGKIKIGMKGAKTISKNGKAFQQPKKIDHFIITTLERDENDNFVKDEAIHKILGDKPKKIPIKLLYNKMELNFHCRYSCYYGAIRYCFGDGEFANRIVKKDSPELEVVKCPCERGKLGFTGDNGNGKGICKINSILSVVIDCQSASIGSVWKFRTHGYNSTVALLGSLMRIDAITAGRSASIKLDMFVTPKVATVNNKPATIYVVSVDFNGSEEELKQVAFGVAKENANYCERIKQVEKTAQSLISYDQDLIDESADIVEEFYPEELAEDIENPEEESTKTEEKPPKEEIPTASEGDAPSLEDDEFGF